MNLASMLTLTATNALGNRYTQDPNGPRRLSLVGWACDNGLLNPEWLHWFMGFPEGWTKLKPLETHKFQGWQQQHSQF
jgi:hypothetical protein